MKLTNIFKVLALAFLITSVYSSCSGGVKKDVKPIDVEELTKNQPETHGTEIKDEDIPMKSPLDQAEVANGKNVYDLKCSACHKLTDEKLVGPGWQGVTKKRKPAWIINMITNVDMMLATDPEAQKLLEQCLVRMPNQNVSQPDALNLLSFMRSNDGEK
ncbi:MAG: cytochrome c [Saprospiraceae bacterium]|nr:cytochrome c [Candidatus Vicinibacter affinis]MBK8644120.1 cytochrome c [Candidatus Vicinibacter affinis]MBK9961131.1 cytochrome c [Candidatus Vicinibacter affinis]